MKRRESINLQLCLSTLVYVIRIRWRIRKTHLTKFMYSNPNICAYALQARFTRLIRPLELAVILYWKPRVISSCAFLVQSPNSLTPCWSKQFFQSIPSFARLSHPASYSYCSDALRGRATYLNKKSFLFFSILFFSYLSKWHSLISAAHFSIQRLREPY